MNNFNYSVVNCLFTGQPIKTFDDLSEAMQYVEEIDKSDNKRWVMTDDGWFYTHIKGDGKSKFVNLHQLDDYAIVRNHPFAVKS